MKMTTTVQGTPAESTAKMQFTYREWNFVPAKAPKQYYIRSSKTGRLLCTVSFPGAPDIAMLKRMAAAPELEDVAEMFHDSLLSKQSRVKETCIFSIVAEVLRRLQ